MQRRQTMRLGLEIDPAGAHIPNEAGALPAAATNGQGSM